MVKPSKGTRGAYGAGRRNRARASDARTSSGVADDLGVGALEVLRRPAREVIKFLDDIELFDELNAREKEAIADMVNIVRCPGGTVVYESGDEGAHLYVVIQGEMELRTRVGPGMQHTFRMIEAGQCAGLDAMLSRSDYHMQCIARDKTAALRFRSAELHQALDNGHTGVVKLFAALGMQLGQQIRRATLEVVFMLEKTSMMPAKSEAVYDDDKLRSILGS